MDTTVSIDFGEIARDLRLPLDKVQRTVELLDDGNTVPFITRYRKDQTGGLDEEQIRLLAECVTKSRLLADRKATILKSIESQGKLTPQLESKIRDANSTKRLEDLYLPFKPKKQTLATVARQRGLEPLANDIFDGSITIEQLAEIAPNFVRVDKQLNNLDDVMLGVQHLLAERYGERADLRGRLRKLLWQTGKLVSHAAPGIEIDKPTPDKSADRQPKEVATKSETTEATVEVETTETSVELNAVELAPATPEPTADLPPSETPSEIAPSEVSSPNEPVAEETPPPETSTDTVVADEDPSPSEQPAIAEPAKPKRPLKQKSAKRDKKKQKAENAFKDYFDHEEPLKKIPPHRILAINRGERAKTLRVKVEADMAEINQVAEQLLIPEDHPHREFLLICLRDALARLVLPSLEREIRRELTEESEQHAVDVFARNLRNLLLQPPVRGRSVLAIDPGFRNGCKIAAIDQFGNVSAHQVIHIIGNKEQLQAGRQQLVELIKQHDLSVIAIGNGTACRQTEQIVSDILADELKDRGGEYVVVNEAGASVYSTSTLGREELPDYDATIRGAISIGRRLLDPLSELVKINAANIGVGLYQHDVKANHLRDSLDDVVASCVNYVGVDVNTASPALLRYVSGLNQLTARRLYEHRQQHGPFRNREQLKDVPGFGEATFVQSAGFLKITGGDNPLDATWIHPESYEVTTRLLQKLGSSVDELAVRGKPESQLPAAAGETQSNGQAPAETPKPAGLGKKVAELDRKALVDELGVGELLLKDIISSLARPGRDPREDLPPPIFRRGIVKLEDLKPGMELTGSVLNVVDFGAFVDIGLKESGLVHISRLADRFVGDAHNVVSVGDTLRVWVVEIDKDRRRVSLTAIKPGTERPPQSRRDKPKGRSQDRRPQPTAGAPAGQTDNRKSKRVAPPKYKTANRPPPKPKPVKPITKKMVEGKEAMRSFSDLKQFFEIKKPDEDEPGKGKK